MHAKKFERLVQRITLESASFCATSWQYGIAGTAMQLFDVQHRNFTWAELVEKFAEVMRIPADVAYALELPDVPNEVLKYVPAHAAVMQLYAAKNGASADEIQTNWRNLCDAQKN